LVSAAAASSDTTIPAPADGPVVTGVAQTTVDLVVGEVVVEHIHGVSPG
jgi:hypothetical protein